MNARTLEDRFAHLIEGASGNVVPPTHYPFLTHLIRERAQVGGFSSPHAYLEALERGGLPGEWREILPRITVKESYLFRTPQHFEVIARVIVPELVRARASVRRLRAFSAGCARGEEPASLAMVLAEHPLLVGWDWRITATDIDHQALAQARRGVFNDRAVQSVPEGLRQRYLSPSSGGWQLDPALLRRIHHHYLNLVHEPLRLEDAPFDIILLRNVLIYFRPASQRRVAHAIAGMLAPDGTLFLGPAETLWRVTPLLIPIDAGGCFYYRLASSPEPGKRPSPPPVPACVPPPPTTRAPLVAAPATGQPPEPTLTNPERLRHATEAAAANQLDKACTLIEEALVADPSDPLAHSLEGFLHDVQSRPQQAIACYRAALFLQPELPQVRLLLALCLRRLGWEERCRQELRQALSSLSRGSGRAVAALTTLGVPSGAALRERLNQALAAVTSST